MRDYLDYGNSVIRYKEITDNLADFKIFFKNIPFEETYIYDDREFGTWAIMHVDYEYDFRLWEKYPKFREYYPANNKITINKREVRTLYCTPSLLSIQDKKSSVIRLKIIDQTKIIYEEYQPIRKIYWSKIGNFPGTGYGKGDGLSGLGTMVLMNYITGSQYLSLQKINSPPMLMLEGIKSNNDGLSQDSLISHEPGASNILSMSSTLGIPTNLAAVCQPISSPQMDIKVYAEMSQITRTAVAETYKNSTLNLGTEIPNETATSAQDRIAEKQHSFKSRAECYTQRVLLPLLTNIMHLVVGDTFKEVINLADQTGIQREHIKAEIVLKSFIEQAELELKKLSLERELQVKGMLAQMMQVLPEEEQTSMTEKINTLYSVNED
jgi:hypothetical protein